MKTLLIPIGLALTLSCFAATGSVAAEPAKALPAKSCCPELPGEAQNGGGAAAFTRDSLYQLDARFTDDSGRAVALGELRGHPVVVTMFFASCSYACPLLLSDLARIRAALPERVRENVVFALVSFDTVRDTSTALRHFRTERQLDASWRLLRGEDDAIRELAALLGVKYKLEADGQFAHSNLLTVLNAEGEIVFQRSGLNSGIDDVVRVLTTEL